MTGKSLGYVYFCLGYQLRAENEVKKEPLSLNYIKIGQDFCMKERTKPRPKEYGCQFGHDKQTLLIPSILATKPEEVSIRSRALESIGSN